MATTWCLLHTITASTTCGLLLYLRSQRVSTSDMSTLRQVLTRSQRTTKWRPYVSQISADRRLYETLTSLRQLIFNALSHSHPRQHSQYSYLTQAPDFHLPYSQSLLTVLLSLLHHSLHQGRDRLVMVCQDGNDLGSRCKDLPAIAPY